MSALNPYQSPAHRIERRAANETSAGFHPPVVVHYTGMLEDLVELNVLVTFAMGARWRRWLLVAVCFVAILGALTLYAGRLTAWMAALGLGGIPLYLSAFLLFGLAVIIDYLWYPAFVRWWLTMTLSRTYGESEIRRRLGSIRLTISEESITEEVPHSSSRTDWCLVERVEILPEYCFLFLSQLRAYIVPRRAFDSDEEFESFCCRAQERLAAERPGERLPA